MFKILMATLLMLMTEVAPAPTTDTAVGRRPLQHPDLGHDGGATLHTKVRDAWTLLSNDMPSRYYEEDALADSANVEFIHNFQTPFTDLGWVLYSRDGSDNLTIISGSASEQDPEFTVAVGTDALNQIKVTNEAGGTGVTDIAILVYNNSQILLDVSSPPQDGQALVYDQTSRRWEPGASGDSTLKLQALADPTLTIKGGRITGHGGRQFVTYDGAGTATTDFFVDLNCDMNTLVTQGGGTPATGAWVVYVDLAATGVDTIEVLSGNSDNEEFFAVECTSLIADKQPTGFYGNVDSRPYHRYMPLGFVNYDGAAWDRFANYGLRQADDVADPLSMYPRSSTELGIKSGWITVNGKNVLVCTNLAQCANGNTSTYPIRSSVSGLSADTLYYMYLDMSEISLYADFGVNPAYPYGSYFYIPAAGGFKTSDSSPGSWLLVQKSPDMIDSARYVHVATFHTATAGATLDGAGSWFGDVHTNGSVNSAGTHLTGYARGITSDFEQVGTHEGDAADKRAAGGWTVYDDDQVSGPVDGTGATDLDSTIEFVGGPGDASALAGNGSLKMSCDNTAETAGEEGFMFQFKPSEYHKELTAMVSFEYNFGNGATGSPVEVFVYRVATTFITPTRRFLNAPSAGTGNGGKGTNSTDWRFDTVFPMTGTSDYRIMIHCPDDGDSLDLIIDNFSVDYVDFNNKNPGIQTQYFLEKDITNNATSFTTVFNVFTDFKMNSSQQYKIHYRVDRRDLGPTGHIAEQGIIYKLISGTTAYVDRIGDAQIIFQFSGTNLQYQTSNMNGGGYNGILRVNKIETMGFTGSSLSGP